MSFISSGDLSRIDEKIKQYKLDQLADLINTVLKEEIQTIKDKIIKEATKEADSINKKLHKQSNELLDQLKDIKTEIKQHDLLNKDEKIYMLVRPDWDNGSYSQIAFVSTDDTKNINVDSDVEIHILPLSHANNIKWKVFSEL